MKKNSLFLYLVLVFSIALPATVFAQPKPTSGNQSCVELELLKSAVSKHEKIVSEMKKAKQDRGADYAVKGLKTAGFVLAGYEALRIAQYVKDFGGVARYFLDWKIAFTQEPMVGIILVGGRFAFAAALSTAAWVYGLATFGTVPGSVEHVNIINRITQKSNEAITDQEACYFIRTNPKVKKAVLIKAQLIEAQVADLSLSRTVAKK